MMDKVLIRKSFRSPNFDDRPKSIDITTVVIHDTRMQSCELALDRLCMTESKVSAHYLISKEGEVFSLVDEEKRAWHAGRSYWRGKEALNDSSIGIELDNPGDKPFPKEQMKGLKALCLDIILRYSIQPYNIVAHSDIAPDRKADPNSNFEWEYLYSHQIGLYSEINLSKNKNLLRPNSKSNKVLDLKGRLFKFGYRITNLTMDFDHELLQVIHAFKRRFVPETYHINFWDELSDQRLDDLLQQIKL